MALTDKALKALEPRDKDYKVSDGAGLYVLVKKTGSKYFRMKYRFEGKEKVLALGVYPEVSLKEARLQVASAKAQLADKIDPSAKVVPVQETVHSLTFARVHQDWYEMKAATWMYKAKNRAESNFRLWIDPAIGSMPIDQIEPLDILNMCKAAEADGKLETAHRLRAQCSQVFRYGIILRYCRYNPARDLTGALKAVPKQHFASITDPAQVGKLMVGIHEYEGTAVVHHALACSAYWFCRPGEVRHVEWSEVDLNQGLITLPGSKMKMGRDHIIPMCTQSVALLKELYPLTSASRYVFPSLRGNSRPMSENTINQAIRNLGYAKSEMTAHGFRAMARTLLDEELQQRVEWIEHQLAHEVRDATGRAYNRTAFLNDRKIMMQTWADYLDELRGKTERGEKITRRFNSAGH